MIRLSDMPGVDDLVRQAHAGQITVAAAARKIGCSESWVCRRYRTLGLPYRRAGYGRWSDQEKAILAEHGMEPAVALQRRLKKAGYTRGIRAIDTERYRLRLVGEAARRDARDHYTLNDLTELLCVSQEKIRRWIADRRLPAATPYRHVEYVIQPGDLRAFLLAHPDQWEPGRCDKYWLIDLLRG